MSTGAWGDDMIEDSWLRITTDELRNRYEGMEYFEIANCAEEQLFPELKPLKVYDKTEEDTLS